MAKLALPLPKAHQSPSRLPSRLIATAPRPPPSVALSRDTRRVKSSRRHLTNNLRPSFRSVQLLFESRSSPQSLRAESPPAHHSPAIASPVLNSSPNLVPTSVLQSPLRFDSRPVACPPSTLPDPRKCSRTNRPVIRKLFDELQYISQKSPTLPHTLPSMDNNSYTDSKTLCKSDTLPTQSHIGSIPTLPSEKVYAQNYDASNYGPQEVIDNNSESVDNTDLVSEVDQPHEDGSYAQYHGHVRVQHHQYANVRHEYHEEHREVHARHVLPGHGADHQVTNYGVNEGVAELGDGGDATVTDVQVQAENNENINPTNNHFRESSATTNSFDQVAEEIAEDLEVFQQVEEQELHNLAELIPERNQDRLFSEVEPTINHRANGDQGALPVEHGPASSGNQEDVFEEEHSHEEAFNQDQCETEGYEQEHVYEVENEQASDSHHCSNENIQPPGQDTSGERYEGSNFPQSEGIENDGEQTEDCGCDDVPEDTVAEQLPVTGAEETSVKESDQEQYLHQDDRVSQHSEFLSQEADSEATLPGPPPSFGYRGERLSHNVADAMALIWDKFWAEDVRDIIRIIKNRFSQIMPYIRRFLAHLAAFWGGITYIRRAITAFVRLLKRDERVRELLERVGWASASTLRVFLSMCAMIMQAMLQFYHLLRDRIIPDTRRVIPILYYKAIMKLLSLSYRSPWAIVLGPFSITFAIDGDKLSDRYLLHDKLGVPRDDVTFAFMQDIMTTVRQSVYRSRYPKASPDQQMNLQHAEPFEHPDEDPFATVQYDDNEDVNVAQEAPFDIDAGNEPDRYSLTDVKSTPVHTQTTDEVPVPPPSGYSGPMYPGSKQRHVFNRLSNGPLAEMTNIDGES